MKPPPPSVVDRDGWRDVKDVDENGIGLTQWEIDFVDRMLSYLLAGCRLTAAQREKLQQISEERLP